jgi:DNA-binding CsgD family transcriptional regulator
MKATYLQHQLALWRRLTKKEKFGFEFDEAYSKNIDLSDREDYVFRRNNLGILRGIVYKLNDDRGWCDSVAMHFHKSLNRIPDKALSSISELLPHLSKSVELSRTFNLLQERYQAVLTALDHVTIGLCIVKPDGQLVIANAEANRIFDDIGSIRVSSSGRLVARKPEIEPVLAATIRKAVNTPANKTDEYDNAFHLPGDNSSPLLVEGIHLRDSSAELGEPLNCALLTVVDLDNTRPLSTDRLCSAYALSGSEAAVCKLMAEGWTKKEMAEQRNVSPETIKSQISAVYRKTNSRNRADLVRLILQTTPPVATID